MKIVKNTDELKYPLRFAPILKQRVWGGVKYDPQKNNGPIGESWEISGLEENVSVVTNGKLEGIQLNALLEKYQEALVGKQVYRRFGNTFPLLFKFIDAAQNLSVQLHPKDSLARERHNSFGKTEMWYIIDAEEEANLILGFNREIDKETYKTYLEEKRIADILQFVPVKSGEAYLVNSGLVHAICKGVFLAEVQQASDITYRIYDWNRLGVSGKPRELHTELALDAIDFEQKKKIKLPYSREENIAVNLCDTIYFTTNKLFITDIVHRDLSAIDSFVVYMCVKGKGSLRIDDTVEEIQQGESVMIPANCIDLELKGESFGLLEVYVPKQV